MTTLTLHPQFGVLLSHRLGNLLKKPPVILTLGSDKFTADCFGPLTGHYLKAMGTPAFVYGCLDAPLNATTLPNIYNILHTKHINSPILAVDSMIGNRQDIGKLKLIDGGIYPGSGSGKNFPLTGTVSLTAIIADRQSYKGQGKVGLGFVHKLSVHAAKIIHSTVNKLTVNDNL